MIDVNDLQYLGRQGEKQSVHRQNLKAALDPQLAAQVEACPQCTWNIRHGRPRACATHAAAVAAEKKRLLGNGAA